MHKLEECEVWKGLTLSQKKEKAQCVKHPWTRDHTTGNCTFKSSCWKCKEAGHHQLFCPKIVKASTRVGQVSSDDDHIVSKLLFSILHIQRVIPTFSKSVCLWENVVPLGSYISV